VAKQQLHELGPGMQVDHQLRPDWPGALDAVDLGQRVVTRVSDPDADRDIRGKSHRPDIPEVVGRA
jgi:hypothetical protein